MNLPFSPPLLPMLAKNVDALPRGGDWIFEPKWDGFRTIVFRDGGELVLQSRDGKALNRYFPELEKELSTQLPKQCVLDGEIVVARGDVLDFDALQQRIHPAASRVKTLSVATPASVVFWDLLALGKKDVSSKPFHERRSLLEKSLVDAKPPIHLTPATTDRARATDWFRRFEGAGLDGVVIKAAQGAYEPDRRVMLKWKHERVCDCVVAGFRWQKGGEEKAVGSLLLGLYDEAGVLQHVGAAASFTAAYRAELLDLVARHRMKSIASHPWSGWQNRSAGDDGPRMPGAQSRWSRGKDSSWEPLRPTLVIEVAYDHMQGDRFRHLAQFRRWRSDKKPAACTYAQLEVVPPSELAQLFSSPKK
jgi:ATP-dependent DNA ligase